MIRNRYDVVRRLGAGATGAVFEVRDRLRDGARMALKAMWPEDDDGALLAALQAEMRVLAGLRHPQLCRVFDFGRLPADAALEGAPASAAGRGGFFLTRELVVGGDLGAAALAAGRAPGPIAALGAAVARGLDALHRAGMRHGDFKPANAIVEPGGRLRLIDFGLAAPETAQRTAGTPAYMAPELCARGVVDRRVDLYALGISLYQLVSGELPSGDRRGRALIDWHASDVRPDAGTGALARVIERLWAPDPDDRMATAAEAGAALEAAARALGVEQVASDEGSLIVPPLPRPAALALERAFDRRRAGEGGPALIELVGDAGSGRTTALTELSWRVALRGAEVVWAGAGGSRRVLGVALDQLGALTGAALPVPPADGSATAAAAAVAGFLAATAERWPLVVILDDADHADAATRELARFLAYALPAAAPVLLVAARTAGAEPLAEVPGVAIEPASATEVATLLEAVAGRRDPELAARVHLHTGGNLLHVTHTLSALAGRGFPPAAEVDDTGLPPALELDVGRRLEHTRPLARAICEVLAVLERSATPGLVAEILASAGAPAPSAEALAAAVGSGDRRLELDPAGRIEVARPAVAQAVYRRLEAGARARLHRAAASALGRRLGDRHPEVVTHQLRGGEMAPVVASAAAAVRALAASGDMLGAVALGAEAIQRLGESSPVALRLETGEAARAAGDIERIEELLGALVDDDEITGADRHRAWVILGRACDEAGRIDRAQDLLGRAADQATDPSVRALAARELSRSHIKRGQHEAALAVAERALATGASGAHAEQLAVARAFAAAMLGDAGASSELDLGADRAAAAGDDALAATAAGYAALLAFRRGDYHRAQEAWDAALGAAERSGDVVRTATTRMNLGSLAFHVGDYGRCLDHHSTAVRLLCAAGAETPAVVARKNLGHLLVELGAYEQARAELDAARAAAERLGLAVQAPGIAALQAIAAARAGDLAGGLRDLEAAGRAFAALGDLRREVDTRLDLAELVLDRGGTLAQAAAELAAACDSAPVRDDHLRAARFLALSAELAARSGDPAGARRHLAGLDQALARVRAEGNRHLEWTLEAGAARTLAQLGDTGAAGAREAAAAAILESQALALPAGYRTGFWNEPRRRRLRPATPVDSLAGGPTWSESRGSSDERPWRLLGIYRRMSSERDPGRLLELVMDAAVELSGAERGFLLLGDDPDGGLRTAIAHNLPAEVLRAMALADREPSISTTGDLPYSRTVAERVFRTGELVLSNDPRADPRFDEARSVHALHLESVVCIPVHARGRVAGVLYLESRFKRVPFSEADLRLLSAFGDQVAILLENARLLHENVERAAQLERAHGEIEALLADRTALLDRRTEELALTRRDLAAVRRRFLGDRGAFGLIGRSPAMERVFELIERLAATDVPVVVLGESGTGKELVARALHEHGPRRAQPMTSVNCGALPETLLESELFGHERGAFTSADRTRRGLFESANGGTLFLDEIGDTPLRMQATLLRALQEGVIRRVGGVDDITIDVRIVAATNRNLEDRVREGRFREDLYYRLHVVPIQLPALRERAEDIPLLAEHFLTTAAARTGLPRRSIAPAAMRVLLAHGWPGNVRQLEHAITNALVLAEGEELGPDDFAALLGPGGRAAPAPAAPPPVTPGDRLERERARILEALEQCEWNRSKAARILQMPRRTFYRRLAKYGIH